MKLFGCTILAAAAAVSHAADIVDTAAAAGGFDTLLAAATAADLVDALRGGSLTVFAPTNDAFAAIGGGSADQNTPVAHLLNNNAYNKALLTDTLLTHVIDGVVNAGDLTQGLTSPTLGSEQLTFDLVPTPPTVSTSVNTADIDVTDIAADNGVIHVVDSVLLVSDFEPKTIATKATEAGLTVLVEALAALNLVSTFDDVQDNVWTVFAPTDAAFANLLTQLGITKAELLADTALLSTVLNAHVMTTDCDSGCVTSATNDRLLTLGGEKITVSNIALNSGLIDIKLLNGYVHVIDEVILPNSVTKVDLAATAGSVSDLSTLVAAAGLADLVGALQGPGPLTVFAPVNSAFDAIGASSSDMNTPFAHLTNDIAYSKELLADVIKAHVVGAQYYSEDLPSAGVKVATLEGEDLDFDVSALTVSTSVNTVNLVPSLINVEAKNGVAHVVDAVLLPGSFEAKTIAAKAQEAGLTVLVEALVEAGLVSLFDDKQANAFTVFAPTDAAFVATLQALGLTKEELFANKDLLVTVLQAHVVAEPCDSTCVTSKTSLATVGGESVAVGPVANTLVGGAFDIKLLNGYVHVVDSVIIPPSLQSEEPATEEEESSPSLALTLGGVIGALVAAMALVALGASYCSGSSEQARREDKSMAVQPQP